jgi:hypothetical protein
MRPEICLAAEVHLGKTDERAGGVVDRSGVGYSDSLYLHAIEPD